MTWIVGVSKPQRELWGQKNIERQGFETYMPQFRDTIIKKGGQVGTRIRCLFPRYIFINIESSWHFLLSTYGMSGIVLQGEEPAVLPSEHIEAIRAREGADGLIHLPPPKLSHPRFNKGDKVRVTFGPFTGFYGIVQGMSARDRVQLLLDFLNRKTPAEIERRALVAA